VGSARPLCPCISDIDFFGYLDGIVDFDAQVSHGRFKFSVAKQKLHRP